VSLCDHCFDIGKDSYLVLLILGVLFDVGVFSGGHRSMKRRNHLTGG
jgi:hypothetical protein